MEQTQTIGGIAEALSKAQSEIKSAQKDSVNPHFRSNYADLASVWDACREALTKNGLAISQTFESVGTEVILETTLMHKSGEWIRSKLPIESPKGAGSQKQGSAITYARRYALAAIVGVVADEDDDGEQAEGRGRSNPGGNRGIPKAKGTELKLNPNDSGNVPRNAGAPVEGHGSKNEQTRKHSEPQKTEPGTQVIPNHAANLGDPNQPVLPSHLRELADTGRKQGWDGSHITELTRKMMKKDSPRDLTLGELKAVKSAISSMTVEQMQMTSFD